MLWGAAPSQVNSLGSIQVEPPPPRSTPWGAYRSPSSVGAVCMYQFFAIANWYREFVCCAWSEGSTENACLQCWQRSLKSYDFKTLFHFGKLRKIYDKICTWQFFAIFLFSSVYELRNEPHSPIRASRWKINLPRSNLTCPDWMHNLNLYVFISNASKLLIFRPQFTPLKKNQWNISMSIYLLIKI